MRETRAFLGSDAAKRFSLCALLWNGFVYATSNTAVVRCPSTYKGAEIAIPSWCLDELLRLTAQRYSVRIVDGGLYFVTGDTWVHALTDETMRWPEEVKTKAEALLSADAPMQELDKDAMSEALDSLTPFMERPFVMFDGNIARTLEEGPLRADVGGLSIPTSAWHPELMRIILDHATHMDFSAYPKPCRFKGMHIEGVAVGLRI